MSILIVMLFKIEKNRNAQLQTMVEEIKIYYNETL
jgi:hypothetical protein